MKTLKVNLESGSAILAEECYASSAFGHICEPQPNFATSKVITFLPPGSAAIASDLDPRRGGLWSALGAQQDRIDHCHQRLLRFVLRLVGSEPSTICIFDDPLYRDLILGHAIQAPIVAAEGRNYIVGARTLSADLLDQLLDTCCQIDAGGGVIGSLVNNDPPHLPRAKLKIKPSAFVFSVFDEEHYAVATDLTS